MKRKRRHHAAPTKQPPGPTIYIPAIVFGAIGAILLVAVLIIVARNLVVLSTWRRAVATVIHSDVEDLKGNYRARIEVQLTDEFGGSRARVENGTRGSNYAWVRGKVESYSPGTSHPVHIHPDDPRRVRVNVGFNWDTFLIPSILGGAGLLFALVGGLAFASARRSRLVAEATDEKTVRRLQRFEMVAAGGFVLFIGVSFLAVGVLTFPTAMKQTRWPLIDGTVVTTQVLTRSSGSGKYRTTTYYALAKMRHRAGGTETVSPVDIRVSAGSRKRLEEKLAERFPSGSTHQLRQSPENPHDVRIASESIFALPLIFSIAGVAVTALAVFVLRKAR